MCIFAFLVRTPGFFLVFGETFAAVRNQAAGLVEYAVRSAYQSDSFKFFFKWNLLVKDFLTNFLYERLP